MYVSVWVERRGDERRGAHGVLGVGRERGLVVGEALHDLRERGTRVRVLEPAVAHQRTSASGTTRTHHTPVEHVLTSVHE